VQNGDGRDLNHKRVSVSLFPPAGACGSSTVRAAWKTPFANSNYTVTGIHR
jgi:hypothetical protein